MSEIAANSFDKSSLRRQLRRVRAELGDATRRNAGSRVLRHALSAGLLKRGRRLAFYVPANSELDILPLLNRALWLQAACFLPIVPPARQRRLWFGRLGDGPHWSVNRFDIPEYGKQRPKVRAGVLDIVFLPLLGFDLRGFRMGMGGGYYDASLAFLKNRRKWRRPRLVGIAFDAQKCDHIPNDPWDVPLDMVITEAGVYRFRRGG
jgi:5-formyltetrahydrofolate cyclo-ligase